MERLIPEDECAQRHCIMTTTGCWGRCQLLSSPGIVLVPLEESHALNLALLPFDALAAELRLRGATVTPAQDGGDSSSTNVPTPKLTGAPIGASG